MDPQTSSGPAKRLKAEPNFSIIVERMFADITRINKYIVDYCEMAERGSSDPDDVDGEYNNHLETAQNCVNQMSNLTAAIFFIHSKVTLSIAHLTRTAGRNFNSYVETTFSYSAQMQDHMLSEIALLESRGLVLEIAERDVLVKNAVETENRQEAEKVNMLSAETTANSTFDELNKLFEQNEKIFKITNESQQIYMRNVKLFADTMSKVSANELNRMRTQ